MTVMYILEFNYLNIYYIYLLLVIFRLKLKELLLFLNSYKNYKLFACLFFNKPKKNRYIIFFFNFLYI